MPPPPQVSPDGRFYWDGSKWVPLPAAVAPAQPPAAPPPASNVSYQPVPAAPRQRSARWAVIAVAVVIIGGCATLTAIGRNNGSRQLNLAVDARGFHPLRVGDEATETLSITNNDTGIQDLVVFYADGSDNWADHHVVTEGFCRLDKSLKAFHCGALKSGQSVTIVIAATARDSGNFSYGWGLGDDRSNDGLRQWGQTVTWSEAVSP